MTGMDWPELNHTIKCVNSICQLAVRHVYKLNKTANVFNLNQVSWELSLCCHWCWGQGWGGDSAWTLAVYLMSNGMLPPNKLSPVHSIQNC